ncbi:MAG: DUF4214 domain-containing protein [Methylococcales bacterium]
MVIALDEFQWTDHPKKINLGCGYDLKKGFLNIDLNSFHDPDLVCDATNLAPLPSNYYEHILANDILEHIPRTKCLVALREWNRVLANKATLELQVPNIIGLLDLFTRSENQNIESHERLTQCLFGTQCYRGDYHYNGFTEITVAKVLTDSGFEMRSIQTKDDWLFFIVAEKTSHCERDSLLYLDMDADFIKGAYLKYFKREPDSGGMAHYLDHLKNGGLREEVLQSLRDSDENIEN